MFKPLAKILLTPFLICCTTYENIQVPLITRYDPTITQNGPANTVLVGGCFDVLHYGHIQFLKNAKAQGNYLIVALEPDVSITKYKKRTPVHDQRKRAENLAALRMVDEVLLLPSLNGFDDYFTLVKSINPKVIAVTHDDPQLGNKQKQADAIGAKIVIAINHIEGFSSSQIIRKLSD